MLWNSQITQNNSEMTRKILQVTSSKLHYLATQELSHSIVFRYVLSETNAVFFEKGRQDNTPPTSDYIFLMLRLIRVTKAGDMFSECPHISRLFCSSENTLDLGLILAPICATTNVRLGLGLVRLGASHPVRRCESHQAPECLHSGL